jgi:hypothetical protein
MKALNQIRYFTFCLPLILLFLNFSCSKDEDEKVPDQLLEHDYAGTMTVRYTNVYPEWDETASMEVEIDKEMGLINFEGTTLNYSGETVINNDSKIERSGSWGIDPAGRLEKDKGVITIPVDAGVTVINDIQRVYARDNDGKWQLMNETPFDSEPNSDLVFGLAEAETGGSVVSAESEAGSIIWTLYLTVDIE